MKTLKVDNMIIYISPKSTLPHLSSDKIFGSIIYGISQLYPDEVDKIVKLFRAEKPPFIISSAFPFIENNGKILRFYPKPMIKSDYVEKLPKNEDVEKEIEKIKQIKNFAEIEFVDEDIFNKLITNEIDDLKIFNSLKKDYFIKSEKFLLTKENNEIFNLLNSNMVEIRPQNSINRLIDKTQFFYTEGQRFSGKNGLFFLIRFNEDLKKVVIASLKFLEDRGLGNDISSGRGEFIFDSDEKGFFMEEKGQYFTILSRFFPNKHDINNISKKSTYSFYNTGFKQGRKTSGAFKQKIRFFKEGSVFPAYNEFYGCVLIDNESEDKYIEYGIPFTVKCVGSD